MVWKHIFFEKLECFAEYFFQNRLTNFVICAVVNQKFLQPLFETYNFINIITRSSRAMLLGAKRFDSGNIYTC